MASSNFSSSTSVEMIEQDNLVGLYVTHNQQLDLHSVQMEGGLKRGTYIQPMPASPTKRTTAAAAAKTNGSSRINGHQHQNQQQHFRRFELNAKLFAINEPYLMKTERESLMQQLLTDQAAAATATEEVAQLAAKAKAKTNGTGAGAATTTAAAVTATKTVANRTRKRKKALTKKVTLLDQNLASDEERRLAMALIQRCLLPSLSPPADLLASSTTTSLVSTTTTTTTTASPSKAAGRQTAKIASSPAKRKQQQGQSSSASANANSTTTTTSSANNTTSSTNSTIINKDNPPTLPPTSSAAATTAEQLLRASLATGDSNQEAQSFVGGLFRNRFESLNYRGKVFCNPFGRVIRAKIGLSSYLIPARCSFAGADICEGLQALKREITARRVTLAGCSSSTSTSSSSSSSSSTSSSSFYEPFYVLLDPAWDNNKSVKRKKSYETVSLDYLRRMCRDLKELIDEVLLLKREQQQPPPKKNGVDKKEVEGDGDNLKQRSSSPPPPPPPVVVAVWTTKADKDFVLSEMLPLMQATAAYELKWHKVTIAGCPVKVHGGLEYLLVAERWWTDGGDITTTNGTTTSSSPPALRSGLLVSVPSAVHSHKPTPVPVLRKLYGLLDHHSHHHHPHLPSSSTLLRSNSTSSSSSSSTSTSTSASSRTSPENSTGDHQRGRSASTSAASSASSPAAVVEQFSYGLAESEVISPLVGVELFARYLQSGFHSIGYECIKLQNEELFTSRIVQ